MPLAQTHTPALPKPLRLWPGVVIVAAQWLLRFVVPVVLPDAAVIGVIAGVAGGLLILLWWLFFSRAAWSERVGAVALMILGVFATSQIIHESIAGGMMGGMLIVYSIPTLSLALVACAVMTRHLSGGVRWAGLVAAIVLAFVPWTLVRTAGIIGTGSEFHWRWTPTPEERLLASADDPKPLPLTPSAEIPVQPIAPAADAAGPPKGGPHEASGADDASKVGPSDASALALPAASKTTSLATAVPETEAEWPGFRGPNRDGIVPGIRIDTDWSASPPVAMWRRPIGPGWSSFAVQGDVLYTQEQRGDDEVVAAYKVSTGEPVWRHRDPVRFWESNGGAGPRATPTLSDRRVYTFGATGILNALDAATGKVVWSRNVASETNTTVPDWGFASSPLVVDDLVIVAADATLVAYDRATGRQRWVGPVHRGSYSSPQRTTIDGVQQVLLQGGAGAVSLAPSTGSLLWEHAWQGVAIVQPALTMDGSVLINAGTGMTGGGIRRLTVTHGPTGWSTEERWTSNGLKPYLNDFVVHKGLAFGFDGAILASIDLADGTRKWKGGRYGNGQLVLLPDQDLLLVLSEDGELALVSATPGEFKEVARFPAINGKTWNHPVLVGDVLLVRNGEEMAAFRLSLASR